MEQNQIYSNLIMTKKIPQNATLLIKPNLEIEGSITDQNPEDNCANLLLSALLLTNIDYQNIYVFYQSESSKAKTGIKNNAKFPIKIIWIKADLPRICMTVANDPIQALNIVKLGTNKAKQAHLL